MKCHDFERWVSDSLDGILGEDERSLLDRHLAECPSCRAYGKRIEKIQQEAERLGQTAVPPSYWEDLSSAIRRQIEASSQGHKPAKPLWWSPRWAWGAAVLIAAVVFGLLLRSGSNQSLQSDVFTFEACLGRLDQEIGDDAELAGNFNLVLLSSLQKELASARPEENPVFSEDPLLWEGLSEEEWQILERELKKELTS